jgi:hypothetical protein
MAIYTKRIQTMLTEEQNEKLSRLAEEQGKPVSALVREAIENTYFVQAEREARQTALHNLISLDAPVADWEQMEDEIARGVLT